MGLFVSRLAAFYRRRGSISLGQSSSFEEIAEVEVINEVSISAQHHAIHPSALSVDLFGLILIDKQHHYFRRELDSVVSYVFY